MGVRGEKFSGFFLESGAAFEGFEVIFFEFGFVVFFCVLFVEDLVSGVT